MNETIRNLAGIGLCIWGYIDGVKYWFEARKIIEHRSSKGHSRKFINMAMGNDIYRLFYFFFIDRNFYVLFTSALALFFMLYMFWQLYKYYPYRMRGCSNFKRPNLWIYFINSILSNKLRKRL